MSFRATVSRITRAATNATTPARALVLAVTISTGGYALQAVNATLGLRLSDGAGIENIVGTAFTDSFHGNARDNTLTGGGGDDYLVGQGGDDTYVFAGRNLGTDTLVDPSGSDTLDFSAFGNKLDLNLGVTAPQSFGGDLVLILTDGNGFENVVGTGFGDRVIGNAAANHLYGAGGADYLDGAGGDDYLQGDIGQVVFLDFDSETDPSANEYVYTTDDRVAIVGRLNAIFNGFNYTFVETRLEAEARTKYSGRQYVTVAFNDGPGGGIGGESNELDFRNLYRGNRGTVSVNGLLGGEGQPALTVDNLRALTATVTAHELGHMAGLRHADAFGPIGSGIYSVIVGYDPVTNEPIYAGLDPAQYLPVYGGPWNAPNGFPTGAPESALHIMGSPNSIGTTLEDALGLTFFGEREAIRLAFAETGTVVREKAAAPGSHETFATAEPLGVLPRLNVPNTLAPGSLRYGQQFDVSAIAVAGEIQLTGGRSENDVYSFVGKAGDLMNFEVISRTFFPDRGPVIDSLIRLYDASGKLLAWNDDEFESTDANLVDFWLPADGVYYVEVDTFSAAADSDIGFYELYVTRFGIGPAQSGVGDTLVDNARAAPWSSQTRG